MSSTVDTNGFNLASGYIMDLADGGYVGLNFTAQTYPGVPKPNFGPYFPPQTVGFTFNVEAAATTLTTAQYIDEQTQQAEFLRQSILADPTATPALVVLAQNATSWDNLYLNSLQQAGLLPPGGPASGRAAGPERHQHDGHPGRRHPGRLGRRTDHHQRQPARIFRSARAVVRQ